MMIDISPFVLSGSKDVGNELIRVRQAHHERWGVKLTTNGKGKSHHTNSRGKSHLIE
jgi:hypothetical protein